MEQETARREIIGYIEQEMHWSIMAAEPNHASAHRRQRLNDLQLLRRQELKILHGCVSAQDVVQTFVDRAESGSFDDSNNDARALGLPTVPGIIERMRGKARELSLACDRSMVQRSSEATDKARAERAHESASEAPHQKKESASKSEHQSFLLDEGIEETFPASDPVSVKL